MTQIYRFLSSFPNYIDKFPLPHQRERRLTPGEIQAIKNMRADPNIPEDAKPELPEGYE
jgi:hypothetical protein